MLARLNLRQQLLGAVSILLVGAIALAMTLTWQANRLAAIYEGVLADAAQTEITAYAFESNLNGALLAAAPRDGH